MDKHDKGKKLLRLRKKFAYSLEEVAAQCEISIYELIDIEKGNRYPNDDVLKVLLKIYKISEVELETKEFVDHKIRIKAINYAQIAISILLVLAYLLPFTLEYNIYGTPGQTFGFQFLVHDLFLGVNGGFQGIFIALIVQIVLHVLLYTKLAKYSNILKSVFLLINVPSIILFYIIFNQQNMYMNTLIVFGILFISHIGLTLYDMFAYTVGHDYLQDKGKNRRLFILLTNILYMIFFGFILNNTVFDRVYHMTWPEVVLFVCWTGYHIAYIVIKKEFFETRMVSTITLVIPPVLFGIFYMAITIFIFQEPLDIGTMLIILFLFLPVFLVNTDYFVAIIKNRFATGDKTELEQ